MKIKPIFTSTVVKDVFNADGSLWLSKGSFLSYCTSFKSKKFGNFSLMAPNPVHLFIASTDSQIKEIEAEENLLNSSDKIFVYSKLVDGVHKYTTDELLRLDPDAVTTRNLDAEELYKYLYLGFGCLVSLVSAVEAFINQEIPKDHKVTIKKKDGIEVTLQKSEIEKSLRLEEKMDVLANALSIKGYKQKTFWSDFKNIKRVRDNLVHLKTNGSEMVSRNDEIISEVLDFDFKKHRNSIVQMLNFFIPKYIEE